MKYCIANNYGKGFITHEESFLFEFKNYPLNIWLLKDNTGDLDWIQKVNGIQKTKEEAQALLDAETLRLQQEWDLANPNITDEDDIFHLERPAGITLP